MSITFGIGENQIDNLKFSTELDLNQFNNMLVIDIYVQDIFYDTGVSLVKENCHFLLLFMHQDTNVFGCALSVSHFFVLNSPYNIYYFLPA